MPDEQTTSEQTEEQTEEQKLETGYNSVWPQDTTSEYGKQMAMMESVLRGVNTAMPVRVTAVDAGGLGPVGYIDGQIMVSQLTGNNTVVQNPLLKSVPYFRLQGGLNAVIIDPEVGDIGIVVFCQRDISSVKNVREDAPPSSRRRHSLSDGVYIGGILNKTPVQYIQFNQGGNGMTIYSPVSITAIAPTILAQASTITAQASSTITATASSITASAGTIMIQGSESVTIDTPVTTITGALVQTGAKGSGAQTSGGLTNTGGTLSSNGIVLESHVHSGVTSGGSNTGGPV